MANIIHKLWIMLWKNMIIRKRHWVLTLFELLIPIALFLFYAVTNSYVNIVAHDMPAETYESFNLLSKYPHVAEAYGMTVLYSPTTEFTEKLMNKVLSDLHKPNLDLLGVQTEKEAEFIYQSIHKNNSVRVVLAVIFDEASSNGTSNTLEYKIRTPSLDTNTLYSSFVAIGMAGMYFDTGFPIIQFLLDKNYINMRGSQSIDVSFFVQSFPTPKMGRDSVLHRDSVSISQYILPIFTMISFIFLCPSILKRVIEEKKSGIKELMKLMGLKSWMLWFGWFVNALLPTIISITVIVIFLKVQFSAESSPVVYSCGGVVWIFLMLYCISSIFFLFALSSVLQEPTLGMICGIILWIGTYIAAYFVRSSWSVVFKMFTCLCPNIALYCGYNIMFDYELNGGSLKFSNLAGQTGSPPNELLMWHVWLMLVLSSFLFYIFTLYCEAVFPGDFGIAKPWYFPCLLSSWRTIKVDSFNEFKDVKGNENYEPASSVLIPGIKIQGLCKEFTSLVSRETKVAVDGVTLDIYQNQITALLGHNGAGKSTTMLILTGMHSPTSGTVYIDGYDIRYDMSKVRESLGLCPQENMVFMDLTVKEHLIFFGMLKGSTEAEARAETEQILMKLSLTEHQNKKPPALSGGMTRRLCLGIALTGNPKVVMLDEPTSGLDPEARRKIWDLLLSMRGQRTIILTTHIMEEADVLGDRIAIMDHGRIQCYGTSIFLKKLYGTGYHLQITKKESSNPETLTQTVLSILPKAELKSVVPSLVSYNLPSTEIQQFPQLFSMLEKNKTNLGVVGMGVSITTMEEVFLRVGQCAAEEGKPISIHSEESANVEPWEDWHTGLSTTRVKGLAKLKQQIEALFIKRILFMYKTWLTYIQMIVLLILMMLAVTYLSVTSFKEHVSPPMKLTLDQYGDTRVLYTHDSAPTGLLNYYKAAVKRQHGTLEMVPFSVGLQTALLNHSEIDLGGYNRHFVVAAEFNTSKSTVNALYSGQAMHSIPISINLLTNALLQDNMNSTKYSISATNHPFNKGGESRIMDEIVISLWNTIPLVHIFWISIFMILPVTERVSESKQIQLMTGVPPVVYWMTYYIWDFALNLFLTILMIIAVVCIDTRAIFSGITELSVLFCIFTLYGFSAIPFAYLVSYSKRTVAGCYAVLLLVTIVTVMVVGTIMKVLEGFQYYHISKHIGNIVSLVPVSALCDALAVFTKKVIANSECKLMSENAKKLCKDSYMSQFNHCCRCVGDECDKSKSAYIQATGDDSLLFKYLMYMTFSSFIYFILILLIDHGIFGFLYEQIIIQFSKPKVNMLCDADLDVYNEATRIDEGFRKDNTTSGDDALLVKNLVKKYSLNTESVKGLSFGVLSGECFGLVGVNGAGKTTTFKILTGGVIPTRGDVAIGRYSLRADKSKYMVEIGYCPQYDPLIDCFTAWEQLQFFARLRGVSPAEVNKEVRKWLALLDLKEYQNRRSGTYSGGNKRKLSTAIALIGNPPMVFLDEPTSGVDPVSRRKLWSALISIQKAGQSIVLTSHSMEECEALCNRMVIMVEGTLKCLGTVPHLKQKFGQGFTIKLKFDMAKYSKQKVVNLKAAMLQLYTPSCVLKDEHQSLLHYHVTDPNIPWSKLFTDMEDLTKCNDVIEDYTISETTLEQVFLSFAKGSAQVM